MNKELTRGDSFDINSSLAIKGCVIILMMMHHLFRAPSLYKSYDINFFFFSEEFISTLFTYFKLCVGTFAFISGYALAKSYSKRSAETDTGRFIAHRLTKTLLSFQLVYLIVLAVSWAINALPYRTYFEGRSVVMGILNMLADMFGVQALFGTPSLDSSWWYMSAAITFILIVPLLSIAVKKLGWLAPTLAVVLIPRLLSVGFLGGTAPLSFIFSALLGVIFHRYDLFSFFGRIRIRFFGKRVIEEILTFLAFAGAVVLGYHIYDVAELKYFYEICYGLVPLSFILFANRYIAKIPYLRGVLIFFGKHSANMFFIHTVIRSYLTDFIYRQHNFLISIVIFIALSLLGSVLIEFFKKLIRFDRLTELIISRLEPPAKEIT